MNLIRKRQRDGWWDPFHELETLQNEIGCLFDSPLSRWANKSAGVLESI